MKNNEQKQEFLFEKINYKILLIGIGVIALGFILMSGGGSEDPTVFNEDIFNFRRIRLAPTTVLKPLFLPLLKELQSFYPFLQLVI